MGQDGGGRKKKLQKICMTLPTERSFPKSELENLPATPAI